MWTLTAPFQLGALVGPPGALSSRVATVTETVEEAGLSRDVL